METLGLAGNGKEFRDVGGQVFRVPVGENLLDLCTGLPVGSRWECTRAHFDRFKHVLVIRDDG